MMVSAVGGDQSGKEIGFSRKGRNLQLLKGVDREGCNIGYRLEGGKGKSHLAIYVQGTASSKVAECLVCWKKPGAQCGWSRVTMGRRAGGEVKLVRDGREYPGWSIAYH